jgi:hypothetical protein
LSSEESRLREGGLSMRAFVIHDSEGNIQAVVTAAPDAPPVGPSGEAAETVSEVELEDYPPEAGAEERHQSLMRLAQDFRVEFEHKARLVRRPDSGT